MGRAAPTSAEPLWLYQLCRQAEANFSGPLVARRISPAAAAATPGAGIGQAPGLDPRGIFVIRSTAGLVRHSLLASVFCF